MVLSQITDGILLSSVPTVQRDGMGYANRRRRLVIFRSAEPPRARLI